MDTTTIISIFGVIVTIAMFYNGYSTIANGEITVQARHSRPYVVSGTKCTVIGAGNILASVFVGLGFLFGIKLHSLGAVVLFILAAGGSLIVGLVLAIFVPGSVTRKEDDW